ALLDWKHIVGTSWMSLYPERPEMREGETFGIIVLSMGVYTLSFGRIVYTFEEGNNDNNLGFGKTGIERFGFAYGTLPTNILSGEQRFMIELDMEDRVWFDVLFFSKAQHWMAKIGYPIAKYF